MNRVVIATANAHKIAEIRAILSGVFDEMLSAAEPDSRK
jgi:inosine/xanthosine triphosphate pyrophosphatase family protein